MPVDVGWLYENRVIMIRQHGRVTSAHIAAALDRSRELINQGTPPVHIITDSTDVDGNIEVALGDLRQMIPKAIEGSGLVVGIHPRALDRFMSSLGMQIAGVRYKFAKNEQEALETLLEYDPTLNDFVR
jgi:hypothetical protein